MIKILHTADWHLGKKLDHISRLAEQQEVLEEICDIAEREEVDAVIIAGDLFDTVNPSIEAIELFYKTLKRLSNGGKRAVIGIAGNHDSPDRIEAPEPLARECGIILTGYPHSVIKTFDLKEGIKVVHSAPGYIELKLPRHDIPLRLVLTPYANEVRMKKFLGVEEREKALRESLKEYWTSIADEYLDDNGVNVLVTHLYITTKEKNELALEDDDERSVLMVGGAQEVFVDQFPQALDYVALGHLHAYINVQKSPYPVCYSGSPLSYSVNDKKKEKYVLLVELSPGEETKVQPILLKCGKKTVQQSFESIEEAIQWLEGHQDYWVELSLKTDTYLSAKDRKRLLDVHGGIVRIIPELRNPDLAKFTSGKEIDLSKGIKELFKDYFTFKKGNVPDDSLMDLLDEVLHTDVEE